MRKPGDVGRPHPELEELFSDLWRVRGLAGVRRRFRPPVDCYRTDDPPAVTVVVDLAGIDPDDVELAVTERTVVISGARRRPAPSCRASYRQLEIEYGTFQRRVSLAEDVDPDAARATYEHGFLTVVLPLAQKPRPGRVSIELGKERR
jgi:HSP20 family protein